MDRYHLPLVLTSKKYRSTKHVGAKRAAIERLVVRSAGGEDDEKDRGVADVGTGGELGCAKKVLSLVHLGLLIFVNPSRRW